MFRRIAELGLLMLVVMGLFSFVDNDKSHYLASIKDLSKVSILPAKPGFKVDRKPLSSCANMLHPIIEPDKGGLLRGVGFGMSKSHVKELEQVELIKEEDLKVIYKEAVKSSENKEVSAILTYDFDHNKLLDIISIDYFATDALTADLIFQEYVSYFNARFGEAAEDEDGYLVWEAVYNSQSGVPVSYHLYLKNISKREDAGVSLQYVMKDLSVVQR